MKCTNCNYEVSDNLRYCPNCGSKLLKSEQDNNDMNEESLDNDAGLDYMFNKPFDDDFEEELTPEQIEEMIRAAEEAERKAKEEAERKAKEEAERKAREEAERKAREEAERKAREEAERKAREEAERKAREEAERKAREEAERKAREEAERKAREEAERKAREEAERKAREEAERKAREEAERKAREEAERKAREEAKRKAREEAVKKAKAHVKVAAQVLLPQLTKTQLQKIIGNNPNKQKIIKIVDEGIKLKEPQNEMMANLWYATCAKLLFDKKGFLPYFNQCIAESYNKASKLLQTMAEHDMQKILSNAFNSKITLQQAEKIVAESSQEKNSIEKVNMAIQVDDDHTSYPCPACGSPIKAFQEVCNHCGEILEWEDNNKEQDTDDETIDCPSCGAPIKLYQKVCGKCGEELVWE
ncbi:MAG: zinc ribbon domain-containing protein [Muribaculaceae bacterium]|nr:zinc ribbon domain-containing protein [Muribaculaceae bacterium]